MAAAKPAKVTPVAVREFRERHGLDQEQLDCLLGFTSRGRATRRWESVGAPFYVAVLMAYINHYGIDLAISMAHGRCWHK